MLIPCPMNPLPATDGDVATSPHFCSATGPWDSHDHACLGIETRPGRYWKDIPTGRRVWPLGPVRATSFSF